MGAPQEEAVTRRKITVKQVSDIPAEWEVLTVRKKTAVRIRPAVEAEEFKVSWQEAVLVSDPAVDLIVIQPDGKEYPCKTELFYNTYIPKDLAPTAVGMFVETWIKGATSKVVRIPEGFDVEVITLEGVLPKVAHPDFIAIGSAGELYANTKAWADDNLLIVSQ